MIQVFISINNNEEVIQLPVPPSDFSMPDPWNNEKVDGLQQTLNLIGIRGLQTIEIKSFFPIRDYPFLQNRDMWGMEYVNTIKRWRERRIPIRIIIVDSIGNKIINLPVTIDEFEYGMRKDGDIYYLLLMTEFKFIDIRR